MTAAIGLCSNTMVQNTPCSAAGDTLGAMEQLPWIITAIVGVVALGVIMPFIIIKDAMDAARLKDAVDASKKTLNP